ncbi:hypothetical protein COJ46_16170 [Bacillus sp. AFS077874]|uniref:hypothetical protein n=1 Tax=unclassified Bacillus (in: firmicutes) TaxID=185979 RepID=UPI000BEB4B2F|nr:MULTISPECIES: hypothetical protein [unclassified Bacillus (in: firmicutes)]PEC51858.1 hypothetical protein CON00_00255 [Bacillus sp. AFS096315]PFM79060.1 hypothetical protein COJ46_16170 [Bacillus sp. AFS077874]
MDQQVQTYFENLESNDKNLQYEAFDYIISVTKEKVDWSYEVWDRLKSELTHIGNHKRSRAAQFLSNLAISDPEKRMLNDFPKIWQVTYDPKFVTARHTLQSIWRVGLAGPEQRAIVLEHLENRYVNCKEEKNDTLIRYDIIQCMRNLYDAVKNEEIKQKALELIQTEEDPKYRKKYMTVWK